MQKPTTFVGRDAHKVAIKLAALVAGATKLVEWSVANEKGAVRRMVRKVQSLAEGAELCFCYEADLAAKYWRSRPFVFSPLPRCHGLCGSQK